MKRIHPTSKSFITLIWVMFVTLMVGCQAEPPLPTSVILPSLTPTSSPTATYTPSRTPTPYMTPPPSPTEFFGRTVQAGPGKGLLRVMNLMSDGAPLDFYLDGVPFITGLRQNNLSAQAAILPHTYTASFDAAAGLAPQSLTITANQNIDVLAVGGGDTRQFIAISQPTDPLDAGQVWLSFANAAPIADPIVISLDDVTISSLTGFSATTPAITAAGQRLLRATANGQVILEETIQLRELTLYTFIFAVNPNTSEIELQRLDAPVLGRYVLRVVNLSPESRELDIYLNDDRIGSNLGLGLSTAPREVVTGLQRLSVYTAGADRGASMPLINEYVFTGQAGSSLVLLLTGAPPTLTVTEFDIDLSPVPQGKSRVVFFNATDEITAVVAGTGGMNFKDFRPVAQGQFSEPSLIAQDEVNFTFTDAANPNAAMFESKIIPLPAGQSVLYAVTGSEDVLVPIYGYPVAQSEALTAEGTPIPQSRLRFINGLQQGIAVDIYVNGVLNTPMLFSGVGGSLNVVTGEDFALLVRQANDGPALLDIRLPIPSPGDYSVFIYGSPLDGLQATLIPDATLRVNNDIGTLRLINLSGDITDVYSLGYYVYPPNITPIAPTQTPIPTPTPRPDPNLPWTPAPTLEPLTAPQDVRRILRNVQPRTASNQNVAPQGYFDLILIDDRNRILGELKALQIPIGQHYDIVAYTYRTATAVQTILFIAPYPPR